MRPIGEALERVERLVDVQPTTTYPMLGVRSFGRGAFAAADLGGTETRYPRFLRVERGDVVYPKLMAWEGAFALVEPELAGRHVSPEFCTFVATERSDPRYVAYALQTPRIAETIAGASGGTNLRRRRLYPDDFLAREIPLPDINEQRRIAAHLQQVSARIDRLVEVLNLRGVALDAFEQSVLAKEFSQFDAAANLGDIATVRRGIGPRYSPDSPATCVNQGCVQWAGMTISRTRTVEGSWAAAVPDEKRVGEFDVLVNSTGEGTIGRACLPGDSVGLPFDSHVLAVRPELERLQPGFLSYYLRSPQGQQAIEAVKGANTTKQTELGKSKIETLSIPLPGIAVQAAAVVRLDSFLATVGRSRDLHEITTTRSTALRASSLNRAFAGLA